jgi:Putative lumazine-binding
MLEWVTVCNALKLAAIIAPLAGITWVGSERAKTTSAEEPGVRVALNAYLEGHATGQADAFKRAFQPDARMLYAKDGHFVKTEIADYIARAPGKPAVDESQRKRTIDFIDIVGDAAIAKLTLTYPEVTFTDYMTLLKIDGEWRIVSKVFHADRKTPKS